MGYSYSNNEAKKSRSLKLTITIPESLVKDLDKFCFGYSYDRSEAIREAIRRFINE